MLILTACGDRAELEDLGHVVVLGVDKAEDHQVAVTFQIANPQVGSTSQASAENEPPSDILTITAPDIVSAKELAQSVASRKLNFTHLNTMIISEELARTKQFHHVIASSTGDREMRREIHIIISKEKASEFIHANKPKLETRPHKYYAFMQDRWRDIGFVPDATINRYFERLSGELFLAIYATTTRSPKHEKDEDQYLAGQVPQQGGDPVQVMGSAVFKFGQMIGTLTGEETRIALFLRPKAVNRSVVASYPDPRKKDFRVTVRLLRVSPTDVKINVHKDPTEVKVRVPLKVQVIQIPSLVDYVLDLKYQEQLKRAIKESLESKANALVKKTQEQFASEPFKWYLFARKEFWTMKDYREYQWEKKYTEAKVQIEFMPSIESFGKQFKPPQIHEQ
nr:Ger(x)C family spore germination C-terminal domain-containing protein [Ammoniphilus resinae]